MAKIWVAFVVLLVGSFAAQVLAQASASGGVFVAATQNREAFVGIVTSGDKLLGYVCDGEKIAEWFRGRADAAGQVSLNSTSGSSKLEAKLDGGVWDGAIILGGNQRLSFRASASSSPAGLYRSDDVVNSLRYLGGWIVLENGEQRGAVIGDGSTRPGRTLELGLAPSYTLTGVGSLKPFLVTPEFVNRAVE